MVILSSLARGGQTWAHRMRMLRQVFRLMFIAAIVAGLGFFAWEMRKEPTTSYLSIWYSTKSGFPFAPEMMEVRTEYWNKVSRIHYQQGEFVKVKTKELKRLSQAHFKVFLKKVKQTLKDSGFWALVVFFCVLAFFLFRGLMTRRKKHLKGTKMQKPWQVKLKMTLLRKKSKLKLGSVPIVKHSETKHFLICGATGTGKTNTLRQLIAQIKARGDRAVIVDSTGDFVAAFFREEKDILLNPYDIRSAKWHPWCECEYEYHYHQLVNSLIPKTERNYDDFFGEAARSVILASLLKHKDDKKKSLEEVVQYLFQARQEELFKLLKETDAMVYVDPKGEKTSLSIRGTIVNYLRSLRVLRDTDDPFSVRDWVLSTEIQDQWLFITCTSDQRRALNPLMSVWFSIAMNAMKSRNPRHANQKIWFIIDELHSLQKLEFLEESLAELRKYGGCIVLATQNVSQLDKIYGSNGAKIILDQCGTKVSFRQGDELVAKRMSSLFGRREFTETQEGMSYGAHEMRDGVNISRKAGNKSTVSPTDILNLLDLQAFIKLPGNWPAIKTKFKYRNFDDICKAYIKNPEILDPEKESPIPQQEQEEGIQEGEDKVSKIQKIPDQAIR